jgi:FkbM family methyltransferase
MKIKFRALKSYIENEYYKRKIRKYVTKTILIHEKLGTQYGVGIIPTQFLSSDAICYSFGAGEDISFDLELIKKFRCKVHIFDPTPRAKKHYEQLVNRINQGELMPIDNYSQSQSYSIKPEDLEFCFFYPIGIWSEDKQMKFFPPSNPQHVSHSLLNLQKTVDYIEVECKRLRNIMSILGHKKITLMKLDIVGAEYEVIDSLIQDKIFPDILLIEFDEGALASDDYCLDQNYFKRIRNSILKLKSTGYILTFVEGWNTTFVRESIIDKD